MYYHSRKLRVYKINNILKLNKLKLKIISLEM